MKKIIKIRNKALEYYGKYLGNCDLLRVEAIKLLKDKNINYNDIFCTFFGSDGFCFTLDLKDGHIPHVIPVIVFFDVIKKSEFTIKDLYDSFI